MAARNQKPVASAVRTPEPLNPACGVVAHGAKPQTFEPVSYLNQTVTKFFKNFTVKFTGLDILLNEF